MTHCWGSLFKILCQYKMSEFMLQKVYSKDWSFFFKGFKGKWREIGSYHAGFICAFTKLSRAWDPAFTGSLKWAWFPVRSESSKEDKTHIGCMLVILASYTSYQILHLNLIGVKSEQNYTFLVTWKLLTQVKHKILQMLLQIWN